MASIEDKQLGEGILEEARRSDIAVQTRLKNYATRYSLRRMFAKQNRQLLDSLGSGMCLLEVGAGIGNFLVDAIRDVPQFSQVHAVEVSFQTAQVALRLAPGVTSISLAPGEFLPFHDNCFDGVIARGVLHHMANPTTAIQEMHRVLRPGGTLVILEGNPASKYRRSVLGIADALHIPHEDTHYRHLYPTEIAERLAIFQQSSQRSVNGMFAPLGYVGFGGQRVWDMLDKIAGLCDRLWPNSFAWWLLWIARK